MGVAQWFTISLWIRTSRERFVESTAPTKIAVSKNAFVIDGWVVADRVEEVKNSIEAYCSYIDVNTDVAPKHHGLHGHHDHNSPSPPIAFGDHGLLNRWNC